MKHKTYIIPQSESVSLCRSHALCAGSASYSRGSLGVNNSNLGAGQIGD